MFRAPNVLSGSIIFEWERPNIQARQDRLVTASDTFRLHPILFCVLIGRSHYLNSINFQQINYGWQSQSLSDLLAKINGLWWGFYDHRPGNMKIGNMERLNYHYLTAILRWRMFHFTTKYEGFGLVWPQAGHKAAAYTVAAFKSPNDQFSGRISRVKTGGRK